MSYLNCLYASCDNYDIEEMFVGLLGFALIERNINVNQADTFYLSGGPDINPALYGEKVASTTVFNSERDEEDRRTFDHAMITNKFLIGICRGAQYIHARMGGRLWQHVEQHRYNHSINYEGLTYNVTSTHHQMMRDVPPNAEVLLRADVTNAFAYDENLDRHENPEQLEALLYRNDKGKPIALSFQPHPEYDNGDTLILFAHLINRIRKELKEGN